MRVSVSSVLKSHGQGESESGIIGCVKKCGIIGGLGPASTVDYYNGIIAGCRNQSDDNHYPEIIINSIDMTKVLSMVANNEWDGLTEILVQSVREVANAGADFAAIASNTPHIVFGRVAERSALPLISIVDETCKYAQGMKCGKVLVIGTLFTMRSGLYTDAFTKYGMTAQVPTEQEQKDIFSLFYPNLENGIVVPDDKEKMLILLRKIITRERYDALVLGCTELPLMIKSEDIDIRLINTTQIHIDSIITAIRKG